MPFPSATARVVRGISLAFGLALAFPVGFSGCSSTSLSAAEVRVPVLLGPVPCIGCATGTRSPAPMPLAHVVGRRRFYSFWIPPYPWGIADDTQRGISADRLLGWTPCLHDLQLSKLSAHSWQLTVPFIVYIYDVLVEADATEVIVPGASCPLL